MFHCIIENDQIISVWWLGPNPIFCPPRRDVNQFDKSKTILLSTEHFYFECQCVCWKVVAGVRVVAGSRPTRERRVAVRKEDEKHIKYGCRNIYSRANTNLPLPGLCSTRRVWLFGAQLYPERVWTVNGECGLGLVDLTTTEYTDLNR